MSRLNRNQGFTMIELLVALVIAMIGTLAIMQIYISGESGKRALGSLGEAQTGALIALHQIERDLQHAGVGFNDPNALGCNIRSNLASNLNNRTLQPVSIVPAGASVGHPANLWGIPPGDNNSDMLLIAAGDSGTLVQGSRPSLSIASGDSLLHLENVRGIQAGDFLLISEAGQDCTLTKVTAVPSLSGDTNVDYPAVTGYSTQGKILHFGRNPNFVVYAVRNGLLTRCDFAQANCADATRTGDAEVWVPVANDVVALVAQYGFDTTGPSPDRIVDLYCKTRVTAGGVCPGTDTGLSDAPGSDANQTVRAADWQRVLAIRVAVVTRSGQAEKDPVSPTALKLWPDSGVAPTTTGPAWHVPDQHYRYRAANTVVALRNVIWGGS